MSAQRRDVELCRVMLQRLVDEGPRRRDFDGFSPQEIGYHYHLLAQAGLIMAIGVDGVDSDLPDAIPLSVTWAGHEFLAAANDDGGALWAKAKKHVISPAGEVAFSVLLEWLKEQALRRLSLG